MINFLLISLAADAVRVPVFCVPNGIIGEISSNYLVVFENFLVNKRQFPSPGKGKQMKMFERPNTKISNIQYIYEFLI